MDELEPIIQREVRKRKINIIFNVYIQNLEKWYLKIYFPGSNGETDIETRVMDMGKGEERVRCMKE